MLLPRQSGMIQVLGYCVAVQYLVFDFLTQAESSTIFDQYKQVLVDRLV